MLAGTANVYQIYRKTINTKRKTIKLILFNDKKAIELGGCMFACLGEIVYLCCSVADTSIQFSPFTFPFI